MRQVDFDRGITGSLFARLAQGNDRKDQALIRCSRRLRRFPPVTVNQNFVRFGRLAGQPSRRFGDIEYVVRSPLSIGWDGRRLEPNVLETAVHIVDTDSSRQAQGHDQMTAWCHMVPACRQDTLGVDVPVGNAERGHKVESARSEVGTVANVADDEFAWDCQVISTRARRLDRLTIDVDTGVSRHGRETFAQRFAEATCGTSDIEHAAERATLSGNAFEDRLFGWVEIGPSAPIRCVIRGDSIRLIGDIPRHDASLPYPVVGCC
ncbi:MAG TPA: hypothetical protein VEU53_10075 [Stellaceae bacterium]|nr:hypothetical protein [Stellaceae bacterium]